MKTTKFNEVKLQKATKTNAAKVLTVKKEVAFQNKLNRYALANSKKDFSQKAIVERVTKVFESFSSRLEDLKEAKVKPLANWSYIGQFFNEHVGSLSENDFTAEAQENIEKDLRTSPLGVELTKEQEECIVTFHGNWARGNWEQIETMRAILIEVGAVQGKSILADKKAHFPSIKDKELLEKAG